MLQCKLKDNVSKRLFLELTFGIMEIFSSSVNLDAQMGNVYDCVIKGNDVIVFDFEGVWDVEYDLPDFELLFDIVG